MAAASSYIAQLTQLSLLYKSPKLSNLFSNSFRLFPASVDSLDFSVQTWSRGFEKMEAVGLTMSIASLASLFQTVVDCFEYVQLGRGMVLISRQATLSSTMRTYG